MEQRRGEERREFQRLRLDPIPGTLSSIDVSILEIGVLGARVQHADPFELTTGEFRFVWNDLSIALRADVVRTSANDDRKYPGAGLESGLRFVAAIDDSGDHLRTMLAELVTRELESRSATPRETLSATVDGDRTVRGRDAGYLCYRLEGGVWSRRRLFLPEQPPLGFTVARSEDSAEMQLLCRVYQASDDEGRRLIRMFAELSVSEALQIPPNATTEPSAS